MLTLNLVLLGVNAAAACVLIYVARNLRRRLRKPPPLYLVYLQEADLLIRTSARLGTSVWQHEREASREMLVQAQAFAKLALRQHDAPLEVRALHELAEIE